MRPSKCQLKLYCQLFNDLSFYCRDFIRRDIAILELRKALLMVEMGTSRDPEKMKVVLENITLLTSRVHG